MATFESLQERHLGAGPSDRVGSGVTGETGPPGRGRGQTSAESEAGGSPGSDVDIARTSKMDPTEGRRTEYPTVFSPPAYPSLLLFAPKRAVA